MAGSTPTTQSLVKEAILAHFARRIAEAIYQWDRKNPEARLDELAEPLRTEYEQIGEMVALMSDRDTMRAAFYAAADTMVVGGIARLKPQHRGAAVAFFIRAFQAMKQHLMRQSHQDARDLMRTLSAVDQVAGINTQRVNTKPAIDLSTLDITTGVQ